MTSGNGSGLGLSDDQLRAEVRAVLRDVLPTVTGEAATPVVAAGDTTEIALRTNADLDAFVRRVADLCADPVQRKALQVGRRRFRLVTAAEGRPSTGEPRASVVRVEHGAVTERLVKKAAADGARVVLGRRAVLTPLARDRARSLGVTIEKEH